MAGRTEEYAVLVADLAPASKYRPGQNGVWPKYRKKSHGFEFQFLLGKLLHTSHLLPLLWSTFQDTEMIFRASCAQGLFLVELKGPFGVPAMAPGMVVAQAPYPLYYYCFSPEDYY